MPIPKYSSRNRQPQPYPHMSHQVQDHATFIQHQIPLLDDIIDLIPPHFEPPSPTQVLYRRADETASATSSQNYPTDSKGCLICPTTAATCPTCTGNSVCQQRTLTCHQCPEFYCAPADNNTSKSLPIGGIVGGVIGFLVICGILAGYYYYTYVYRKKHPVMLSDDEMSYDQDGNEIDLDDDQAMMMNDLHDGDDDLDDDNSDYKHNMGFDANNVGNTSSSANNSSASDSIINGGNNNSNNNSNTNSNQNLEKPMTRRTNSGGVISNNTNNSTTKSKARRRLSSYESFTKPQYRGKANNANNKTNNSTANKQALQAAQRRARQREIVQRANAAQAEAQAQQSHIDHSVYLDSTSTNRNSVATSFSTTNASNILPIAYIPGVTVRPTVNNTRSIYSYDSESLFSDLNTIENASIIGDVRRSESDSSTTLAPGVTSGGGSTPNSSTDEVNSGSSSDSNDKNSTMTAIKAQPRLVNVERIEEEEELTDDDDDDSIDNEGTFRNDSDIDYKKLSDSTINNSTSNINTSTLTNFIIDEEDDDDEDSDVDSDIGEITRATSVRKKKRTSRAASSTSTTTNVQPDREILLDIASQSGGVNSNTNSLASTQFQAPTALHPLQTTNSSHGSFVLDVEFDGRKVRPQSDESGERSPFEDPE